MLAIIILLLYSALVGLDISAVFDTIDHDVLASRLESQFGVVDARLACTALPWW